MRFFNNNNTVVGLFDSEQEAEQAVIALAENGFGGEDSEDMVEVFDRHRFSAGIADQAVVIPVPLQGGSGSSSGVAMVPDEPRNNLVEVTDQVYTELSDMDVDDEEAKFYADRVARGGILVVVETDAERADRALHILKQVCAKESIH
jgi:hypothetical protein